GMLNSNAAMAARTVVADEPSAAIHMSGVADKRRATVAMSENAIRPSAIAATTASQASARTAGGCSRRTRPRSPARRRIRGSIPLGCGSDTLCSPPELAAQRLEGAVQIDFEGARRALRQGGRVGERSFLEDKVSHRFALSWRQSGQGLFNAGRSI